MLKGQKNTDKEQGKTKHEAPHSVNYKATQNKNNIGTTTLEWSVVYITGGGGGLQTSRYNSYYKKYIKSLVRIMAS